MATNRSLARSFSGGEITPEMLGRIDLASFQTGLAECLNFEVLPHGPVTNRPGFEFIREVRDSTHPVRLIPFSFSTEQTFALEFSDGYVRFHTQGATLLTGAVAAWSGATLYDVGDRVTSGGLTYYCTLAHINQVPPNATYWAVIDNTVFEIPSPYVYDDLFELHYVQSADVLTITHPSYDPRELRRVSATKWVFNIISFVPGVSAPIMTSATPVTGTGTANPINHTYRATAISPGTLEESLASPNTVTASNDLTLSGSYNTVVWSTVVGALRYNVYKASNGLYGFVGQAAGTSFVDDNITPDISKTPPENDNPFSGADNAPTAVSYFEQRRIFAGTVNKPQNVWMTRTGTESNLSASIPTRDTDAVNFRIAAREANSIRHVVPMNDVILLTSSAVWRVTSVNADAITPSSIYVRPQSYVGASNVQPAVANNSLFYAQAKGGRLRELVYSRDDQGRIGYQNNDITIMAPHLFDYKTVGDMAFQATPTPILWAVSSDGRLLGLTYVPEQKVAGWHHHVTDGLFESVAVIAEAQEDGLYAIVNRTIGGVTKRYVERLHTRQFEDQADAFFVDSGQTYDGAPATVISGLGHLEGKTVAILGDGAVFPQQLVVGGAITLDQPVSKAHIGLPYTARIETLPIAYEQVAGFGQGRAKNVNKVFMRVRNASLVSAGPSVDKLTEYKQRHAESYGSAPALIAAAEIEIVLAPSWNQDGGVVVQQSNPLPVTIVSMCMEASIGG